MTERRTYVWGAAIIVAGALLGATAALSAGRSGSLWRPFAIGLAAYVGMGALVLRWGLEVYGSRGALGAVALAAFAPGARMSLVVYLGQMLEIKVRVHLGRGDIRVTEQLLHRAKILTRFKQMRRERMAEHVRVHVHAETLLLRPALDADLDRALSQPAASL